MPQCKTITDPNSQWPPFCPNLAASYLFVVLFGLTTLTHITQMIWTRKWYSWVICASGLLQLAAYMLRTLSIMHPANEMFYTLWFILILVAPIFTNAYAFMVMGRMVYNFTPTASVAGIRAWRFGPIFVLLDILAFLVQAGGASMASGSNTSVSSTMTGIHIYMGGIGFQQLCIFAFLAVAARFYLDLRRQPPSSERTTALRLLYVEFAVVLLITVRIFFRLAEYSKGLASTIPQHEAYQYVLDSTPMLVALALFNALHPGFVMPGKESNMPSRKQRKGMKKAGQQPAGRGGEYISMSQQEGFVTDGRDGSDVEVGLMWAK
ncbi:hypothetical protein LTR53_006605 [Teratosphaeriaceae sp. CCFEE 6253]|nr:hypothetical protein LTR53_006605 [Teratosphaeriaceae sp. CCFEE 6253]